MATLRHSERGLFLHGLSSVRGHLDRSSARDVLDGAGASGSTLRYAMAYIDAHRPAVLLLETLSACSKAF